MTEQYPIRYENGVMSMWHDVRLFTMAFSQTNLYCATAAHSALLPILQHGSARP